MQIHPVRAGIALICILATVYGMLVAQIEMPDAWWLALGAVIAFYFAQDK